MLTQQRDPRLCLRGTDLRSLSPIVLQLQNCSRQYADCMSFLICNHALARNLGRLNVIFAIQPRSGTQSGLIVGHALASDRSYLQTKANFRTRSGFRGLFLLTSAVFRLRFAIRPTFLLTSAVFRLRSAIRPTFLQTSAVFRLRSATRLAPPVASRSTTRLPLHRRHRAFLQRGRRRYRCSQQSL